MFLPTRSQVGGHPNMIFSLHATAISEYEVSFSYSLTWRYNENISPVIPLDKKKRPAKSVLEGLF